MLAFLQSIPGGNIWYGTLLAMRIMKNDKMRKYLFVVICHGNFHAGTQAVTQFILILCTPNKNAIFILSINLGLLEFGMP